MSQYVLHTSVCTYFKNYFVVMLSKSMNFSIYELINNCYYIFHTKIDYDKHNLLIKL